MNEKEIIKRPTLPDRIQVSVTPSYMSIYDYDGSKPLIKSKYKNLSKTLISNSKLKKYQSKRYTDKKGKFHYVIDIPSDCEYITNIRMDAIPPFTVSFKLNFIRLLRSKIQNADKDHFNSQYDKDILLDENNYISNEIWTKWDTDLVSSLLNSLNDIILSHVERIVSSFYPPSEIQYERVTVNQIETNIDYTVPINQSLFFMNKFSDFINSDKGLIFRKTVGEIALKRRIPYGLSSEPTTIDKNETISIQFQICKGLFAKIYRKTRDHIRFELTFQKPYLQTKFKNIDEKPSSSTNIKRITKAVMEFSKDFFKDVNFSQYLEQISQSDKYNLIFNQLNPVYEFFRKTEPSINDIIDSIVNQMPISDKDTIRHISKNPSYSRQFRRETSQYGNKILVLDSNNQNKVKRKQLLPTKPRKHKILYSQPKPKKLVWIKNKQYVEEWSFV